MTDGSYTLEVSPTGVGKLLTTYAGKPISQAVNDVLDYPLAFGVRPGQFNLLVRQVRPVQPGQSETINLYDGSLLDVSGQAAAFRVLRQLVLWVSSGGDSSGVTVGNAASNPAILWWGGTTPTKAVYPGGPPEIGGSPVGVAVTAGACNLKVTNNGAVLVKYGLYLVGSDVAAPVAGTPMGCSPLPLNG